LNQEFITTYQGQSAGPASLDRLIEMFERGDFDLVAVGRALIVNPEWANLVKAGKFDQLKAFSMEALPVLY
jgi:2,4-dienoyl-CoA reductase-like NADH-dependent reductase (Old Yellow Enzyme family)